jgi:hypothetical protein
MGRREDLRSDPLGSLYRDEYRSARVEQEERTVLLEKKIARE